MKKITFSIEGMHCGSCAAGIQMVVQNLEGVKDISASWDNKNGEVEFDESKVKFEDIEKSISDLGYKVISKN